MKPELKALTGTTNQEGELTITVLFTTPAETAAALKSAAVLAGDLRASIQMIITRVVPFPLQLTTPPVPIEFWERYARKLARRTAVAPQVQIYDCRDRTETLLNVLPAHSVVVMGARHRWFPTRQVRLARVLRRNGHDVVLVDHAAVTKWQPPRYRG